MLRLSLFHALLLERHHYGGLGWRRSYDFSAADFLSSIKQVVQVGQPALRLPSDYTQYAVIPGRGGGEDCRGRRKGSMQ